MKRLPWLSKLALALLAAMTLAGCSSGGAQNGPPTLPAAGSLPASCTAASAGSPYSCQIADTGGKSPFSWSVSGLPAGLSYTVSSDTTSVTISGMPQKQASVASRHASAAAAAAGDPTFAASVSVTVTDAQSRTATLAFTITVTEPAALAIQTTSLQNGAVGTAYSVTLTATGGTTPYTWSWTAQSGSSLPPGLSLGASSGTISGTPTAAGTFNVTISVSDAETPAASTSANFSITNTPPAALVISTSSLANGNVGSAYSAGLSATGGTTPYTWSWAAQSGSSLPPGLSIATDADNTGTISGTPASSGAFQVTVTVKDSETPAASISMNFSITISRLACNPSQTTVCGQFVMLVQGFDSKGAYALAASFTASGSSIIAGVLDMNSFDGTATAVPITGGAPSAVSVGADGRGTLTLATSNGTVGAHTFTFAMDLAGTFADVIEFDDKTANGAGYHASGYMQAQDSTAFNAAALAGNFAYGFVGGNNAQGRFGMVGLATLTSSGCGLNGNGSTTTANNSGTVTHGVAFTCSGNTGLSTIDATTGRGTASFSYAPGIAASATIDYSFYVAGAGKLILIATDPGAAGVPVLSGNMKRQKHHPQGFSNADFACGASGAPDSGCILASSGQGGNGTHVQVGVIVQVSAGSYTLTVDDNKAGVVASGNLPGGTAPVSSGGNGTFNCPTCKNATDFVMTDTDTALVLTENGGVSFGIVSPQTTKTFSATPGTFILSTVFPGNTLVPNSSGILAPSAPGAGGAGTFTGTLDVEQVIAPPFLIPGGAVSGNYTLDAAKGRATGTSTAPGPLTFVIWIVDSQDFVVMETDSGNINPGLILSRQ